MSATFGLWAYLLATQGRPEGAGDPLEETCPKCGGSGRVETEKFNRPWAVETVTCERCGGSGTVERETTP